MEKKREKERRLRREEKKYMHALQKLQIYASIDSLACFFVLLLFTFIHSLQQQQQQQKSNMYVNIYDFTLKKNL